MVPDGLLGAVTGERTEPGVHELDHAVLVGDDDGVGSRCQRGGLQVKLRVGGLQLRVGSSQLALAASSWVVRSRMLFSRHSLAFSRMLSERLRDVMSWTKAMKYPPLRSTKWTLMSASKMVPSLRRWRRSNRSLPIAITSPNWSLSCPAVASASTSRICMPSSSARE